MSRSSLSPVSSSATNTPKTFSCTECCELHEVKEVQTQVPTDAYGACLCISTRALMEGKPMKCCMSWLWAMISVCIQFFLIFTTHEYINREKAIPFKPTEEVENMTSRLSFALKNNSALDAVEDDALIKLCN